ncbi:MAG: arginine deiminase [Firmicutes bacterium]|nr:arginine deiminase [Bacillota bacterium]MBR1989944.1 arginine deiminase [Bacillota bacterium]MBR3705571.1 arginine deiminase [Bacillota bacterium]
MHPGIHNFSEIGKLNKVLLHRPGKELEALTPATMERLLFDDIPYLKVAQEEHDIFAKILRDNGCEPIYYVEETAKAITDPKVREQFLSDFLRLSKITSQGLRDGIMEYLMPMDPEDVVRELIEGIRKSELKEHATARSLHELVKSDYPFVSDPMPNLYFTRDPGACVGNGLNLHHMHTRARRRESLFLKYLFEYNKDFAVDGDKLWYNLYDDYSIEGGDVLVLSNEVVAIGRSERTTIAGIERFAINLLSGSDYKKVLVFDIPKSRAFMHLDTVFTMIDYDKFTIHPEIEGPLSVFEITLGMDGHLKFREADGELHRILAKELHLSDVELIRCGGADMMASQREQWNDGSNTLCIAPGTVITYERNYVTNEILDKRGIKVLTMPSSELSRGRGGPRCMSCPVNRDDL